MQQVVVMLIVGACTAWLGWMGYRYIKPKPGKGGCGAGCCDGKEEKKPARGVMMISSDDLRARVAARR